MNSALTVTPEELREKRIELENLLKRAKAGYVGLTSQVLSIDSYLICSANPVVKRKLHSVRKEADRYFAQIGNHIKALEAIALEYEESERSNTDAVTGIH